MMAPRLRGVHTPPAPKSGSVRNSLRSDSGRFFIRFRHWRRVAIDGDLLQLQLQLQLQLHKQLQLSLRGANCNCSYLPEPSGLKSA